MRHYPIRSAEQGERKVFRERKPRFDPEELARGWHVQYEGLEPGRPLLPDDATALPYDADAARVALHVRNRLVEAAYPSVVPAPPANLATTVRRIDDARARQIERQGAANAYLEGPAVLRRVRADADALKLLACAMKQFGLSARAYHRVLKVARTIADLADSEEVIGRHISEAVTLRQLDRRVVGASISA